MQGLPTITRAKPRPWGAGALTPRGGSWAGGGSARPAASSNPGKPYQGASQGAGAQAIPGDWRKEGDREIGIVFARAPWPKSPPSRPSSHLTSPKLQNPNTVGPPLRGSGTEVGGSGSLTVPLLPLGTPRAKTASGGSGLWTRRPSRLVSSGFQTRPRRAAGSPETDPVPLPGEVHSGIPRQPSLAQCCLRALGHSSPCPDSPRAS